MQLKVGNSTKQISSLVNAHPIYEIKNGIRYVKPYFQVIKTTVKSRWLNRSVLDILSTEFRSFSISEYKRRIENDEVTIIHQVKLTKKQRKELKLDNLLKSNNSLDHIGIKHYLGNNKQLIKFPEILEYKMCDNDIIERLEHIHERSVLATISENIEVIYEDNEILVVNKPSGIPIHPVQNYFFNSFVKILEYEGWPGRDENINYQLRPCHRLDKLTSGICIFAKSHESARKVQLQIQNRKVEKVYLARVKGRFLGEGSDVECCDEIIVLDTKKGKNDGITKKDAKTVFKCVKYSKELDESIVMCWPKTGRTHQIRIHLRNLKHPIVNDPLYSEGIMSLDKRDENESLENYFDSVKNEAEIKRLETETDEICDDCNVKLYSQTKKEDLIMYLHAFSYRLDDDNGWSYQTEWPDWTNI